MKLFGIPLFLAAAAMMAEPAAADPQATGWTELMHSRVRMVRGAEPEPGTYEIGVQIQLDPQWKTYWRMPGDAGIPPEFDFSRSDNLAHFDVTWPAPAWFSDEYGDSVGYHDEVIFPIRVTAADSASPVRLDGTVHFAVCLDICIPASAEVALDLAPIAATPRYSGLISTYRSRVPLPAEDVDGLTISAVDVSADANGAVGLQVDIACSVPECPPDVFVEGPEELYFGRPTTTGDGASGQWQLFVPVTGADGPDALAGIELNIVAVAGRTSMTTMWTLP